jgi:Tfp pilus assembly protein PilN
MLPRALGDNISLGVTGLASQKKLINLLPIPEKEKINSELFKKQINTFGTFIALIFFGSAIFVMNTYAFLKIQTSELKQSLNLEEIKTETQEVKALEGGIKNLNARLSAYQKFRIERQPVINVFLKIKEVVPSGISLNAFLFDGDTKKIILSGVASSRDDVVLMESRLKNSDFFEGLESPLSNFLDKSNSKFNFTFYLKK